MRIYLKDMEHANVSEGVRATLMFGNRFGNLNRIFAQTHLQSRADLSVVDFLDAAFDDYCNNEHSEIIVEWLVIDIVSAMNPKLADKYKKEIPFSYPQYNLPKFTERREFVSEVRPYILAVLNDILFPPTPQIRVPTSF